MKFHLLLILFFAPLSARAESLVLSEGHVTNLIAQGYTIFQAMNGRPPKTWREIESIFNKPLDEQRKDIKPTQRYAFLEVPVPIPNSKGTLVMLSRSPTRDQYEMRGIFGPITGNLPSNLVRYGIAVGEDGRASSIRFPEIKIQELFAQAGAPFPPPDRLGPRPYEKANRLALYVFLIIAVPLAILSTRFFLQKLWKAMLWTPPSRP